MTSNLIKKVNYLFVGVCCLLSFSLNAQQIDVLLGSSIDCAANTFCVDISLQSNSSLEIGTSSIFLDYNENALSFSSYTSTSFDGSSKCIFGEVEAWDVHSFDGVSVPGDFNLTMTLTTSAFSCPSVTNTPVEVGTICFDITNGTADPMVTVNLENTQFNSAASNDGSNTIPPGTGSGINGQVLDCTIPCIGEGGDSDNDGVCDDNDQCPNFDDSLLGQPCDDGDPCTIGDVYSNCGCTPGAFQDTDNDGICNALDECAGAEPGTACDDNDACTTGDTIDNNCNCVGTFQDADNDNVCDASDSCPNFDDTLLGQPCDDGDPCTVGDVYSNCGCTPGPFQDTDNDGICNALDDCVGAEPGTACDDNDACTTNDQIDNNCNCVGTFQDADNDNVCDASDSCPNFDDTLLGLPCDDGDPCTVGDVYSNCGCTPGTTQDSDNDGICDVLDRCPNDASNDCTPTICESTGKITTHEHIQNVLLNTINNASNKEGYGNFLTISTDLQRGEDYPITLTPSFGNNSTFNQFWNVWIDFNQNGNFDDAGEKVLSVSGIGAVQGSIAIPTTNIFNGSTIMRVTMQWEVEPASCGEICYGEVEDYTVSIL